MVKGSGCVAAVRRPRTNPRAAQGCVSRYNLGEFDGKERRAVQHAPHRRRPCRRTQQVRGHRRLVGCIGPGKAIDTDRWFVPRPTCWAVVGGTTGPCRPHPGSPWPRITIGKGEAVEVTLADALGNRALHGGHGGSMGGMRPRGMAASPAGRGARWSWRPHPRRPIRSRPRTSRSQRPSRDWRAGDYYASALTADRHGNRAQDRPSDVPHRT